MTSALQERPRTALDLLFGPGNDAPAALARQIVSAGADGNLGRALESLPRATREAAVREATATAAGLLDVDLIGVLVAGWRKHHDLIGAARRTVAAPGSTELVDMAAHQVTMSQHPSVTVLVDGVRVATLQFGLSLEFLVNAMVAGVGAGRLVALHSGRCDITATLAVQGTNVLTKQAHFKLPGVVPLSPGIRLLSARHYPGPAESAGDNHPPQATPAREGTVQVSPAPRRPGTAAPLPGDWTY
jgi:hypothetical protein